MRPSWLLIESICSECPRRDECTIEDLTTQRCEFLEARIPEPLKEFLSRKGKLKKREVVFEEIRGDNPVTTRLFPRRVCGLKFIRP